MLESLDKTEDKYRIEESKSINVKEQSLKKLSLDETGQSSFSKQLKQPEDAHDSVQMKPLSEISAVKNPLNAHEDEILKLSGEIEQLTASIGNIEDALIKSNAVQSIKLVDSQYFQDPTSTQGSFEKNDHKLTAIPITKQSLKKNDGPFSDPSNIPTMRKNLQHPKITQNLEEYQAKQRKFFYRKLQLEELKGEAQGWNTDRETARIQGNRGGDLTDRTSQLRKMELNKAAQLQSLSSQIQNLDEQVALFTKVQVNSAAQETGSSRFTNTDANQGISTMSWRHGSSQARIFNLPDSSKIENFTKT